MDTPSSPFIKLTRGCGDTRTAALAAKLERWQVIPWDRRVSVFPQDVIPCHNCAKRSWAIEKKGIPSYLVIKSKSVFQPAPRARGNRWNLNSSP